MFNHRKKEILRMFRRAQMALTAPVLMIVGYLKFIVKQFLTDFHFIDHTLIFLMY